MKYSNDTTIPPYQINDMLSKTPLFTTTHLTDYTVTNNYKYAKIKSRYKNRQIISTLSQE